MGKIAIPMGARVLVRDIEPVVEEAVRAAAAGIHIVIDKRNLPQPTSGVIVAVGTDPIIQEHYKVGDEVHFSKYAGMAEMIEGKPYRVLEEREITLKITEDNLPSKLTSPNSTQEEPEAAELPPSP